MRNRRPKLSELILAAFLLLSFSAAHFCHLAEHMAVLHISRACAHPNVHFDPAPAGSQDQDQCTFCMGVRGTHLPARSPAPARVLTITLAVPVPFSARVLAASCLRPSGRGPPASLGC